jgi:O-antigen/teichoic acid export membrane protein
VEQPRQRAVWAIVDQILSTTTNFGLSVILARNVGTTEYGAFAVGFTIYALALGVSRALSTDPLIVRFSNRSHEEQREAAGTAVAMGIMVGIAGGVVLVAVGLVVGQPLGPVFLAFGIGFPFVLWQDAYRYQFIAARRPHLAALNDLVWVVALSVLLAVTVAADAATAAPYIAAWAGAAGLAAVVGMAEARAWPHARRGLDWLRHHADLNLRFAAEFVLLNGGPQLVLLGVAAASGYSQAGGLRGAIVLLGPVTVVATGLIVAAVPEGVRLKDRDRARLGRLVYLLAAVLSAAVVVWAVLVARLPDRIGEDLLGETWPLSQDLMVPLGLAGAGVMASTGIAAGLRSLAAARQSLSAAAPAITLLVIGGVIGAALDGGLGAARGMIVPAWIGVLLYQRQFRRVLAAAP